MKWILWWLVSFVLFLNCVSGLAPCEEECQINNVTRCANCCVTCMDTILKNGSLDETINAIKSLEDYLQEEKINRARAIKSGNVVAYLHEPSGTFEGLTIYASDDQKVSKSALPNSTVSVQLPRELDAGPNSKIVFFVLKWTETNLSILGASYEVYEQRLVGLSVKGRNISGLQQHVNITMYLTKEINETQKPSCQFFNFPTKNFSPDGCITRWTRGQNNITCSCDHLTYTAVLMLPVSLGSFSSRGLHIAAYFPVIGCSLSLFALVITVLLFITNRKLREDVSMKVHINLVIALILFNLHFLLIQTVTAGSSTRLCIYMGLVLHYSMLATFIWMALEGFNLYFLAVKVFNIYVSTYLLKLSVVGWGVPAVIVSVVVIIDFNSVGIAVWCITNRYLMMVTTLGLLVVVFLFNMIMFGMTVRRVFSVGHRNGIDRKRVGQHTCHLLGVSALLGVSWGLIFFSFGALTTSGLYIFCIPNSLQGFFIFLWFVMSLRKAKNSAPPTSSEARSTAS